MQFRVKNNNGEVIAQSKASRNLFTDTAGRIGVYQMGHGTLELISDDIDLRKSRRVFNKVGKTSAIIFEELFNNFLQQIISQSHTLKKLQGQLIQKIEGIVPNQLLSGSHGYSEQRGKVLSLIDSNPEEVADTLLYLQKRLFELGAHMDSFEILHIGKQIDSDFRQHSIGKIINNVWYAFDDLMKEQGIELSLRFDETLSEENKINVDYKTLNAAFYNLFDNISKYTKPYSQVRIYFETTEGNNAFYLKITTVSLRIDQNELGKVFDLGYRGVHCRDTQGSGVGMYIVKKALELNNLKIKIIPDYSKMEAEGGDQYILNVFEITGRF